MTKRSISMDFWDKIADFYDIAESFNGSVYGEMCDITRRLVPRGAKVLDCAAGTGELSLAAAAKAGSVLCTDLSENMLKNARRKAEYYRLTNISFEERNIFHLDDPDETYDVVIAGNVLHLLNDPKAAVKELYRVLKPGGKLLLPTFTTRNKGKLMIKLYMILGFQPSESYSPSQYRDMLIRCGCGTVKTKLISGRIPCCYAVIVKPLSEGTSEK